jgi:hypothetical protein
MFKFGSMCLMTGALCVAGGALAADPLKNQVIPNFAITDKTGWVLDRSVGVDDLLPPPTGGPGPVTFDRPIHMCLTAAARNRPIGLPIFPIRSCSPGLSHR